MIKFSTFSILFVFSFSVAYSQAVNKKQDSKSNSKSVSIPVTGKEEPKSKNSKKLAQPRMVTRDFIKMMSGETEYMKNVLPLGEEFALDYNPMTEKVDELMKSIGAENDRRDLAEVIMSQLPRPVFYQTESQTAGQYHALLEQWFLDNPSLVILLGQRFQKVFENEKAFGEVILSVLSRGYYTKF